MGTVDPPFVLGERMVWGKPCRPALSGSALLVMGVTGAGIYLLAWQRGLQQSELLTSPGGVLSLGEFGERDRAVHRGCWMAKEGT